MNPIHLKSFQELSLDELYNILKLRVDIFVVEQDCAYPELDDEDQDAVHIFYSHNEKVTAYLRIITNQGKAIRIGRVVTEESFRGKGLSSKLMEAAVVYIKANYADKNIILAAQEHLQHFYAKFGFKPVSAVYLEDGIPHIDMDFID
jgi:ElaA protein